VIAVLFFLLSETARLGEDIPKVLPLLLGFMVALGMLNVGLSLVRKNAARQNKRLHDGKKGEGKKP